MGHVARKGGFSPNLEGKCRPGLRLQTCPLPPSPNALAVPLLLQPLLRRQQLRHRLRPRKALRHQRRVRLGPTQRPHRQLPMRLHEHTHPWLSAWLTTRPAQAAPWLALATRGAACRVGRRARAPCAHECDLRRLPMAAPDQRESSTATHTARTSPENG